MKDRSPAPWRACLLDIEGVLVRDKRYRPIDGAVEWVRGLAAAGIPYRLVSNNTTHRPEELVAQLAAAGFPLEPGRLVGALGTGAARLRAMGARSLLWLGDERLAGFWRDEGFALAAAGDRVDAVVLGVARDLTVERLDCAVAALLDDGASLVCLHRNRFWLDERGERRLGPGVWAAGLEALAEGIEAETVGKPSPTLYNDALESIGVPAGETLFISDDPEADLVTAGKLGMTTAFVLSGKYDDHAVLGNLEQEHWPDLICARLADVALPATHRNDDKEGSESTP